MLRAAIRALTVRREYGISGDMKEIPYLNDPQWQLSIDPCAWRSHDMWAALANYIDLLDSRFADIARIMVDNILSIMRADFEQNSEESRIQRDLFNYRQRLLAKRAPAAWRPESFVV